MADQPESDWSEATAELLRGDTRSRDQQTSSSNEMCRANCGRLGSWTHSTFSVNETEYNKDTRVRLVVYEPAGKIEILQKHKNIWTYLANKKPNVWG